MKRVMRKSAVIAGAFVLAMSVTANASAQMVHSVGLGAGLFAPRGLDARDANDVLVENLNTLAFDIKDLRGAEVFGEWMVGFSDRVELGFGAAYYSRTAPSVYADFVNSDQSEIEQDLRLRIIPLSAVVRFLPFGRPGQTQVFLGGGVSVLRWKYSETGEFIDFFDNYAVFRDRYVATGTAVAPVVLGGVRMPIGGDIYSLNAELRYQFGTGDLGVDSGFLTDTIDLSGLHFTVGFRISF